MRGTVQGVREFKQLFNTVYYAATPTSIESSRRRVVFGRITVFGIREFVFVVSQQRSIYCLRLYTILAFEVGDFLPCRVEILAVFF